VERFDFDFSASTATGPTGNQVRYNNAAPASVTHLYVNNMTNPGEDVHTLLAAATVGTRLYVQDWNDHTLYAEFTVAATPVDNTTWVDLPVTFVQAGGPLNNNQRITVMAQTPSDLAVVPPPSGTGGWPTITDVKGYLRLGTDTSDDAVVTEQLNAATKWAWNRCDPQFWDQTNPNWVGYVPDPLFTVVVMEAGRLYRRRDSVDGTIGWGDMGVVRVGPKDPDIETLIAPYLNVVFA
jgi:hypothetical protein